MVSQAPYDEIADWYEGEFLADQRFSAAETDFGDLIGVDESLTELLGLGTGLCLEVGCGTGTHAERLRGLGWQPFGVDISAKMLGYTADRMPAAQADATVLPFPDGSISTAVAVMVHTDMPDYPDVLAEIHRVLRPGGRFVHVGVHPCFCGGFADATDRNAVVIRPGYMDGHWTRESWTDQGIRNKVGASHLPLAELLNHVIETGFALTEFREGGPPTPITLSFQAIKAGA